MSSNLKFEKKVLKPLFYSFNQKANQGLKTQIFFLHVEPGITVYY